MAAISVEYVEAREDEIAAMLTAGDDVDEVRHLLRQMYKRQMISQPLYRETLGRLDRIAAAILTGKRNTATLRNRGGL